MSKAKDPIQSYARALDREFDLPDTIDERLRTIGHNAACRCRLGAASLRTVASHVRLCGLPDDIHPRLTRVSWAASHIAQGIEKRITELKP